MNCPSCGRSASLSGFPGAEVRCTCGAEVTIPRVDLGHSRTTPYRDPPARDAAPARSSGATDRRCPRCAHELYRVAGEGYTCAHCHGELSEHAFLTAEIEAARDEHRRGLPSAYGAVAAGSRASAHDRTVTYLRCPLCDDVMTRMNFGKRSGVIVEVCEDHGTWFDAGEHALVLDFVRAHGLDADLPAAGREAETDDPAALRRRAEATLHLEALGQVQTISSAIETAGDLVWLLFR